LPICDCRFEDLSRTRQAIGNLQSEIANVMMDTLLQYVRYAIRMLLKKPGFTAVVLITLALGIGANTAIFSVVNGVILQPLPFKDAHRLVAVREINPRFSNEPIGTSFPNFNDWEEQNQVFEHIAAYSGQFLTLIGEDEPLRVRGQSVSPAFFAMLEAEPVLGRTFLPEEHKPGQRRVVILSHGFWQRRYGGDPVESEYSQSNSGWGVSWCLCKINWSAMSSWAYWCCWPQWGSCYWSPVPTSPTYC
jgi:MacB-like periplasmic core domain